MAAPAGHGFAQPSRQKVSMRPGGWARASASISQQRAALSASATLACFCEHRLRSSGAGSLRCGAESLSHLRRILWTCEKIAAMVRTPGRVVWRARQLDRDARARSGSCARLRHNSPAVLDNDRGKRRSACGPWGFPVITQGYHRGRAGAAGSGREVDGRWTGGGEGGND